MKVFLFLLAVCCFSVFGFSKGADTEPSPVSEMAIDTAQVLKKVERAIFFRNSHLDSTRILAEEALKESVFGSYKKGIGRAIRALVVYHTVMGNFHVALLKAQEAIPYTRQAEDWENMAWIFDSISVIHRFRGNYDSALFYIEKSQEYFIKRNDQQGLARSYNQMGSTLEKKGEFFKAIDYYDKSLKISEQLEIKELMLYSFTHMLEIFLVQEDYDKALEYAFRNLKDNANSKNVTSVAHHYRLIATVYFQRGELDESLKYSLKSLELSKDLNHLFLLSENCVRIAAIYIGKGSLQRAQSYLDEGREYAERMKSRETKTNLLIVQSKLLLKKREYQKALEIANQAQELALEIGNSPLLKDASEQVSLSSEAVGDFNAAYQSLKRFKALEDSLLNVRIQSKALQQEFNRKEEKEKLEYEARIREQRIYRNVAIIGFVVMIAFGVVISFGFVRQRKAKLINMHQRNELKQHRNQLAELNQELKSQQEELLAQSESLKETNDALNKAYEEIKEKNQNITDSINYANRIQQSVLPLKKRMDEGLGDENYFVLFQPKDIVSGDFYWFDEVGSKKIIAVADCTGHGVPGAFMSLLGNDLLKQLVNIYNITSPDLILDMLHQELRKVLNQDTNEGMDGMDMVILVIDKDHYVAEFSGAMNPLYYVQQGDLKTLKGTKASVGGSQNEANRYFEKHQIDISVPTSFYLCTDGFQDQFGGKDNKKFKPKAFRELLLSLEYHGMEQQREILLHTFETWMLTGKEAQVDDMTIVGVRV